MRVADLTKSTDSGALVRHDCEVCEGKWLAALPADTHPAVLISRQFIVCPTCGNKRCPRATHHTHPCSGSNDTEQDGSSWGALWPCDKVLVPTHIDGSQGGAA